MFLLNPTLAVLGAIAVSVPIIIHLLNRRKFERVVWAAMRFLNVSVEQNQRRLQIEDLLLLILRCLLLLLLGLALARPTFKSGGGGGLGGAPVTAVVLLDNSYSMSATNGVKNRFDLAKEAAEQVIGSLPNGSSVSVLLASDQTPTGPIPEPTFDLNLARQVVRDAKLSDRSTDLFPAVKRGIETFKDRAGAREVFLITDNQAHGWREFPGIRDALDEAKRGGGRAGSTVKAGIESHVIFVGDKEERNLGISDLRLVSGPVVIGYPRPFEVQVTNYGQYEVEKVQVKLRVDNGAPVHQGTIDRIAPGASQSIPLFATFEPEDPTNPAKAVSGGHSVTAEIEHDHVPADDTRTVAVRPLPQVKILLVDGEPGPVPGGRESEVFYLKNALLTVPKAEVDTYFNKVDIIASQNLDETPLDQYDAVFLCNVTDFTEKACEAFADYLEKGNGLIFFPGGNTRASNYNDELAKKYRFLPATLGAEAKGDATRDDQFLLMQDKNFEHPIARVFNDPNAGTLDVHFYRSFDLTPAGDEKGGPETVRVGRRSVEVGQPRPVLRFQDGKPLMMERTWGAGRVVLFASTADSAWNDLGPHGNVFVPLISRTLGSIISRQDDSLNVRVGDRFAWRADDNGLLNKDAVITRPGGDVKQQKKVGLVNGAPVLTFEDTSAAGAYPVTIGDQQILFAAQTDPAESRLDALADVNMTALKGVADVTTWNGDKTLVETIQKQRVGTEIWKYLALAVLALATAETVLAHYFSKAK